MSGPSSASGSPTSLQSDPLDFKWFTATVNTAPLDVAENVCAIVGRFLVSMKRESSVESSTENAPTGVTRAGL